MRAAKVPTWLSDVVVLVVVMKARAVQHAVRQVAGGAAGTHRDRRTPANEGVGAFESSEHDSSGVQCEPGCWVDRADCALHLCACPTLTPSVGDGSLAPGTRLNARRPGPARVNTRA